MNKTNLDIIDDFRKRFEALLKVRDSKRKQETIIRDLAFLVKDFRKDFFLPYLIEMTTHIDQRNTSEAFKHLMSPMKQFVYLIDLYFSVENGGDREEFSEDEWMQITLLLNEIEMTYVTDISFFNEDTEKGIDFDKVSVSLKSFLDYFGNAQLSYEEQTLERLEKICGMYEDKVKGYFGFSVQEAVVFSKHVRNIINQKLNDCYYYVLKKDEWPKLTQKFTERGLNNPKDWWNEPEMSLFKEFVTKPGFVFIHSKEELRNAPLSQKTIDDIISFLTYQEDTKKGITVYYADKNPFFDTPLIQLDSINYLCPPYKFIIECFYNRINSKLANEIGVKYTQYRNQQLECKVTELLQKLFGKDALFFDSYYFDEAKSEQDLLVIFKGFYFIIEIKDSQFRAPMRDPIRAFDKIKSDFKKSIQYGYDQCHRVENKIEKGKPFKIFDSKTDKVLFEIKPNRIKEYFSIIVTQFKYGAIQTNLENLLTKKDNSLYPWSICVDDLEAFILALKKLKKGMARTQFIEYIKYREAFHERMICSDELELCGFFMNAPQDYKKQSVADEVFSSFSGMSDLFDAEYKNGLGFDNEIDIEIKKQYQVPKYLKHYDINIISGMDFLKNNTYGSSDFPQEK